MWKTCALSSPSPPATCFKHRHRAESLAEYRAFWKSLLLMVPQYEDDRPKSIGKSSLGPQVTEEDNPRSTCLTADAIVVLGGRSRSGGVS